MYDIVIVGSGVVGAATALRLAQTTSLSIAVIEAAEPHWVWAPSTIESRVSAISLASHAYFKTLRCWSAIKNRRVSPYHAMQVWDAESNGQIHFDAAMIAEPALGYIIEDQVLRKSLLEQFVHYPQITWLCPMHLVAINEKADCIELVTDNNQSITTSLLIAADGAQSFVRETLGFSLNTRDYEHTAIVATVETQEPHQKTAWQRFLKTGPVAFLPLLDPNRCSIVWSITPERASQLLTLDTAEFATELGNAFAHRLGAVRLMNTPQSFPLQMRHVKHYVRSRVALIGDAAHTIHPLAGQGVNLGLMDAAMLTEVIIDAWKKNRDYASYSTLRRYERARKGDIVAMLTLVQGLKQLFAHDSTIIKSLRSAGLQLTDRSLIKKWLIQYATGQHLLG